MRELGPVVQGFSREEIDGLFLLLEAVMTRSEDPCEPFGVGGGDGREGDHPFGAEGGSLSGELPAALARVSDLDTLQRLTRLAATAAAEEFLEAVRQEAGA